MYTKIGHKGKKYDEKLRYMNNSLLHAAQPTTVVWDKLSSLEAALKKSSDVNAKDEAVLLVGDKVFNITELRTQMDLSLKLLGVTNVQLFSHRRFRLKSFLNAQYQDLCQYSQPMDWRMFRPDVKGSIRNITELNKVSKKIVKKHQRSSRDDFLGQGNPSGQGRSHFYHHNYQAHWYNQNHGQRCWYNNNSSHHHNNSGHDQSQNNNRGHNQSSQRSHSCRQ